MVNKQVISCKYIVISWQQTRNKGGNGEQQDDFSKYPAAVLHTQKTALVVPPVLSFSTSRNQSVFHFSFFFYFFDIFSHSVA